MEKGYFAAAWGDIAKSPGWFSKIVRLGLLCCIPIFGVVVLYGYAYGWARDIAWNVHRPLPDKIFGNEDGNLYKRGFFIFVICFVFSLIPGIFSVLSSTLTGVSFISATYYYDYGPAAGALLMYALFSIVGLVLTFGVMFFAWVGSMRTALYGTLSAGFQIGKIWTMMRYDFMGLLRIFGMSVLMGLLFGVVMTIAGVIVIVLFTIFGVALTAPVATGSSDGWGAVAGIVIAFIVMVILLCLVTFMVSAFVCLLVARALGYWTRQFQVDQWGGQEDPLPFERMQAQGYYQAPPTNYAAGQSNQAYQEQQTNSGQPYGMQQPNAGQPYATQQPAQQPYGAQQPNVGQPYVAQQFNAEQPYVAQQPVQQPYATRQSAQQPYAQPYGVQQPSVQQQVTGSDIYGAQGEPAQVEANEVEAAYPPPQTQPVEPVEPPYIDVPAPTSSPEAPSKTETQPASEGQASAQEQSSAKPDPENPSKDVEDVDQSSGQAKSGGDAQPLDEVLEQDEETSKEENSSPVRKDDDSTKKN